MTDADFDILTVLVAVVASGWLAAWAWNPSLVDGVEPPTGITYLPRCAPAFAGAALVCVDQPRVRTFSTTEAQ